MIAYRAVERRDACALRDAFYAVPVPVGDTTSWRAQRALVAEAIRGRDLFVVAAFEDAAILGYAVVVMRWRAFRRWFAVRHPLLMLELATRRLRRRRKRRVARPPAELTPAVPTPRFPSALERGVSWHDHGPRIAKVLFVGVLPEARGRHIGRQLIGAYVAECARRGFARVDSRIGLENLASIRMSASTGAELLLEGSAVLVVRRPEPQDVSDT